MSISVNVKGFSNAGCLLSLDGDDRRGTIDDGNYRILRNVGIAPRDSFPDVTIDLYAAKASGTDGLHHPALAPQQSVGITHAIVLALMQIALGQRPEPEEEDEGEHGKGCQLDIAVESHCRSNSCHDGTKREADDETVARRHLEDQTKDGNDGPYLPKILC